MESTTERLPVTKSSAGNTSGFSFTAVLGTAYAGFVLLSAFAPDMLARPVSPGGSLTWAFAYGFSVIGLGVVLTCVYVVRANQAEDQAGIVPPAAERGTAR